MERHNSPHILNTSANLLGICFLVLTSLQVFHLSDSTMIDDIVAVSIFLFMASCLFSFLGMVRNGQRALVYETIAEYIFLAGLLSLFVTTMALTFNFIK